jgi:peptidoglycan/xylan/chitin deacetylase (PgdA/CDA1 family)
LIKSLYNPPALIKTLFPDFIWTTKNNSVLLTFDDGPNPATTEIILSTLSELKIKTIFFCVGNNVNRYNSLASEILNDGHSIGNHTYNHSLIVKVNYEDAVSEIIKMNQVVADSLGYRINYFRPPHGKFRLNTSRMMKQLSLKNVMWSLLTYDFKNNLSLVKNSVKKYLNEDSIIVLHDSNKSKDIIRDSILYIADEVQQCGFKFGVPEECLK